VLNIVSEYKLWFEPFLEDRVHCIFIKHDLSDLEEIMTWCLNHDKECEKIAENGRNFYAKYFTKEFVYDYLSDIFNTTSSLIGQKYYKDIPHEFVSYSNIIKPEMEKYTKRHVLKYDVIKSKNNILQNTKTILIVPFRENKYQNRAEQLQTFIQHYNAIKIPILIVTQSDDGRGFNRGALLNIGYDFLSRIGVLKEKKIRYVIMHDVDLIFPVDFVERYYGYKKDIVHFGKNVKNYYDYPNFLGGAIQFSTHMFEKINGFPNHIYGWGGEDDALRARIASQGEEEDKIVYRPKEEKMDAEIPLGTGQKETKDIEELKAKYKNEDLLLDEMIWKMNGLNTIHYKILEKQQMAIGVYNIVVDIH
jgi:hypothetical protein